MASEIAPDWIFAALAAPFIAALFAPLLSQAAGRAANGLLALVPLAAFLGFAGLVGPVAEGSRFTAGVDWLPAFGVRLSVLVDGLSLVFALLITGIGALILLYAGSYLKDHPGLGRFNAFLLLFMGAMLGLVLADDGITLFVFWEGTSVASFLLIGFDHTRRAARRAALQALVITGAGGLCLLAAVLLAGQVVGERSLSAVLASGDALRQSALHLPILVAVLGAAFTKSAQVPLHVWLPNAMEAPTPVSAYLHSATMVKAGVYLLMRLHPTLGGTAEWMTILPLVGGATLLTGGVLALRQSDLKLMLAYTTVASLGLLVMLTGLSSELAIVGAAAYLVAHALFKGALFMIVGVIDHETGTRDAGRLGGLRRAMPATFAAAALAGLSMAGLPPMIGFVAKEALYLGLAEPLAIVAAGAAVLGNAMMFAIAAAVALRPFVGAPVETPKHAHDGPWDLLAGPMVLAVAGLAAGLFTGWVAETLVSPMAAAILGRPASAELHLVPAALDAPVLLSLATIALGVVMALGLGGIRRALDRALTAIGWGPDRGFDQAIAGLVRLAVAVTAVLQHGRLDRYMGTTLAIAAIAVLVPMMLWSGLPTLPALPALALHEIGVLAIAVAGLAAVLVARTRLTAIVSLGIQGFSVAVLFMLFGAPDLSFTQFMVETLSVVILALAITRLSLGERDRRPLRAMIGDGAIALAFGAGFALLLLAVTQVPFDRRLTDFFDAYARTIAHGRNVVNVIIVDFRGVDTLGEIAVVMVTGLAVLALVRIKARRTIGAGSPAKGRPTP